MYLKLKIILLIFICSLALGSYNIESISVSQIKDTVLMVLEVDSSVDCAWQYLSKTSLRLSVKAQTKTKTISARGFIKQIRIVPKTNATDFELTFNKPYDYKKVLSSGGITIKFFPKNIPTIKTIILDPGHGGIDPGAIGKRGLQEKNVNLSIAQLLKKKLEKYGLKVLMTRSDDCFVALSERTRFANEKKGDLFISIHCNASARNRQACGFETYFLSEAKTDWERAVAAKENQSLQFEISNVDPLLNDDISTILSDLAQNEYLKESYQLALEIQTAAVSILKNVDRGVKQAGFYVLRGCFMPAVLVECGFLSNKSEEKKLQSEKYRETIAQTIFVGIQNFIKNYEEQNALR
ncbi:MAG: N-acetylmuramoyl-L-alanine amidase [candidate division WOR-3 bacterium]|nr:N-acetylmuramoyl-L-alanine amidase [candidate division WOR-3 bacterium]